MNKKQHERTSTECLLSARTTDDIISVMKAEGKAAAREKILKEMTPACREKLAYCEKWLRQEVNHTLCSRYELGLQVKELYEDERKNHGKLYGKDAIGRICKILCWDDGLIRAALRFVQTYTRNDLERMCKIVLPNGEPLTWSHVRVLIPIEDANRRKELFDRTVAEGWSCTDLANEIKTLVDGSAKDGRGRPPRVPKDFDGAVAQQQQWAEHWDRLHSKVWSIQDRSLDAHAAKLPPEQVTEERLRQARDLAYQLRRMAEQAREQAEKAEAVVQEFEQILSKRQQVNAADLETSATSGKSA